MTSALSDVVPGRNLSWYLQKIHTFPILSPEEELALSKRWRDHNDLEAANKLVTSHLRLVTKIAAGYRGYGLPVGDLIGEGIVGMMQAVKRFDPDRGCRLASYAMRWIRAAIQEYVLHSWSSVRLGTSATQKRLFFNLRRPKIQIHAIEDGDLTPEHVAQIAKKLGVPKQEVVTMNRGLAPCYSLNAPVGSNQEGERQDWLVDNSESQETVIAECEEFASRMALLAEALKRLKERERRILIERRLKTNPTTFAKLSQQYGISRERVRQIEVGAFSEAQKIMKKGIVMTTMYQNVPLVSAASCLAHDVGAARSNSNLRKRQDLALQDRVPYAPVASSDRRKRTLNATPANWRAITSGTALPETRDEANRTWPDASRKGR